MSDDNFIKELQISFITELSELIESSELFFLELEKKPLNIEIIDKIFQVFHTIKGSAGAVGFDNLSQFTHKLEDLLSKLKKQELAINEEILEIFFNSNDRLKEYCNALKTNTSTNFKYADIIKKLDNVNVTSEIQETGDSEKSGLHLFKDDLSENIKNKLEDNINETNPNNYDEMIRISSKKIRILLDSLGEQVILQSILDHSSKDIHSNLELIAKTIVQQTKVTTSTQKLAMSLMMFPVKSTFNRLHKIIRDTAKQLDKKVEIIFTGEETELDKTLLDELIGPLTHIVRNSVDHGMEEPSTRIEIGKKEIGKIEIKAFQKGNQFHLKISDDGRGIDLIKIEAKAVENGIIEKENTLTEKQILDLIFVNGFSTKEEATSVSGRGVGLDVVNEMIKKLKGTCNIDSTFGKGTSITIALPISLSVFNGTVVEIENSKYVVSNSDFGGFVKINSDDIRNSNIENNGIINIQNKTYKTIVLKEVIPNRRNEIKTKKSRFFDYIALLTEYEGKNFAILVDELVSQERIIFKSLGRELSELNGISGGTILRDGQVALIVQLDEIVKQHIQLAA